MNDKPSSWEYLTTTIILILCICWTIYEYHNDPLKKIPFEPIISTVGCIATFVGYLYWKKSNAKQNIEPIYNAELTQEINLNTNNKNSKNVVNKSNLRANRDIHIGDKNTIIINGRFLLLLLLMPALMLFLSQSKQPLYFTISFIEKTPNTNVKLENAKITLKYGDETKSQTVKKEAIFTGIPASFKGKIISLRVESEGFITIDTSIIFSESMIEVSLTRNKSLSKIFGIVKDERGHLLSNVDISIQDIYTKSLSSGYFQLNIPYSKQRKFQRLRISKNGFKTWDNEVPVIENEEVQVNLQRN